MTKQVHIGVVDDATGTNVPYHKEPYAFIDLFAGIGGMHIAYASVGAKCAKTTCGAF